MASSEKRLTKAEIRAAHQAACKEIPCNAALAKRVLCPFCPWVKEIT
jgi:hypothetical protein